MIVVQSPLRVSLFGGGTDFPSYFSSEGGCVLSSAIDKYIFVNVKKRFDRKLRVGYTRTEMVDRVDDLKHELIREALRMTGIVDGVEVTTMGDIPAAGSGLGSSSTVTVGTLQSLYAFLGETASPERLAREACEIEINILGKPIGVQDQYIAAFGGLRFMEFQPDGRILIESVRLEPSLHRRLETNLLLFFTGVTRQADTILSEQKTNIKDRLCVLQDMKALAYRARNDLLSGNLDAVGSLLHDSWQLKRRLASKISNGEIDDIYALARKAGALGGKITGAGGGGFLLVYCPLERQDAVRNILGGLQELPFRFERDGAKVVFNYQRAYEGTDASATRASVFAGFALPSLKSGNRTAPEPDGASREVRSESRSYAAEVSYVLDRLPFAQVDKAVELLHQARLKRRQVFIFGNGGSAATAAHFVCDLVKNVRREGYPDFRAIGLSDNTSVLTAYANDEGYENIFANPLASFVEPGDVVIAISASGNSPNVVKAIELARGREATTIAFTGLTGGRLGHLVDLAIRVPSQSIEQVEDVHLMLEHMIVTSLREQAMRDVGAVVEAEFQPVRAISRPVHVTSEPNVSPVEPDGRRPRAAIELLYAASQEFAASSDHKEVLPRVLQLVVDGFGAESGSLALLDQEGRLQESALAYEGKTIPGPAEQLTDVLERGLAGWVIRHRKAAIVPSTRDDPRWLRRPWDEADGWASRSAICVPLKAAGQLLGVLTLVHHQVHPFEESDLALLGAISVCLSLSPRRVPATEAPGWIG